ncbi:VOC family protein [Budvicia aquatica]|uniref:Glyoxalase-like domain n=1 Tax=Budvicia aquatica TaxID=82979 RepID=A0A2C6DQ96_9GAMM|nr:glyoxalase/bleomycin resistance/dioxygenase family protein [Budvicia aquatica]PHI30605.1 glyoxalase/bleomycin resistance/dioxygenase family protein [Budvicia aquatica]VFS50050.1 Glyoxalase-like domain [Budvicia aquatica]
MKPDLSGIEVLFVAGFGPITQNTAISKSFYVDSLGLPLKPMDGNTDYILTGHDALGGVKHFALWPLSQAAYSCFGTEQWPDNLPVPQGWIEFEVSDIDTATDILSGKGYQLLVAKREEPWGQIVTRLLSPEGLLTGVTITPWLR